MNTVVDIAEIIGGLGILVAILYAVWQVREARSGREATFLASAFSQSPTEVTIEMELVRRGAEGGILTFEKFIELPDERQQKLLAPLNMFDLMGWMVSMGAIRLDSVTRFLGTDVITRSWDAYQPFVEDMRKNMGDYLFIFFEDLARRTRQSKRSPRGGFRRKAA